MIFDAWSTVGRTLLVGVLAYAVLVFVLRVTGKRTLSKWNAFDFVVTIALGSTLSTTVVSGEVSLVKGAVAFSILVVLQMVVTWISVRAGWAQRLFKSRPSLLLYEGRFQEESLRRERVTHAEVRAALRGKGVGAVEDVAAVVLETDGSFSVIENLRPSEQSTLIDVDAPGIAPSASATGSPSPRSTSTRSGGARGSEGSTPR